MRLYNLFGHIAFRRFGAESDPEITGLHYDSRCVRPGGVFFALPGLKTDGTRFIDQAAAQGALAVVSEKQCDLPRGVTGIQVHSARQAMAWAAAAFWGSPTSGIPVVGVTGTNGKTTVAYLIEGILRAAGCRPAVLGTIEYRLGTRRLPSPHTTPESTDLQRILSDFRKEGADAAVMEVSSHALAQHRVDGVDFNVGVFTNLTPEHLDYHGDMEGYYASKRLLFSLLETLPGSRAVINIDDPSGVRLAQEVTGPVTCGFTQTAAVRPRDFSLSLTGIEAAVETPAGTLDLRSSLLGEFNLQNLLCAVGAGIALGLSPEEIAKGLADVPSIPGRLERIENGLDSRILVDYAHTGDALDKALRTLAALRPRRIITVFGCGGDRDRGKRPVMGEIAGRYSDLAILTSDNPRSENPQEILKEVRSGIRRVHPREWTRSEAEIGEGRGFTTIPDRREAIGFAVSLLGPGDLLLVAGKGHEDYQIIGGERLHFDDREEIRRALRARGE